MKIYAVLAPPARAGSAEPEPDRFVLVKDGFCWPALYFTIPWLIWRRMWLVLVLYVLLAAAVFTLAGRAPPPVGATILLLFSILVALEANNLRRWTLERRGYRFVGVVSADRASDAEHRFFAGWSGSVANPRTAAAPMPVALPRADTGEIVGLFPTPGARP
jgi:hypothetical protein